MTITRESIAAVRQRLHEAHPRAFKGKGAAKVPLAIGIDKAIRAAHPDLTRKVVGAVLRDYTRGPTYLAAEVEGVARVDLDGNPVGEVTAEQAEWARSKLAKRVERIAAQRARRAAA